jgi:hypothetical protein
MTNICYFCKEKATLTAFTFLGKTLSMCEDCWGKYGEGRATSFSSKIRNKKRKQSIKELEKREEKINGRNQV